MMNDYLLSILMKQKEKDILKEINGIRLSCRGHSSENTVIRKILYNIFGSKIYLSLGFIGLVIMINWLY